MDVSLFIARRLRFRGRIAMVSIAVSFLVMIISVSVSSGFRNEIRDGISSISGDIQLTPVDLNYLDESSPIESNPSYLHYIDSLSGVREVNPAVYRAGIVKNGDNIHGVLFKGVESHGKDTVPQLGASIPSQLASILDLCVGDDIQAYFIGEKVRVRKFRVSSIYDGIMSSDENLVVYTGMKDLQRLNGWNDGQVSVLEVSLFPEYRSVWEMRKMEQEIGSIVLLCASEEDTSVVATSAVSRYPQVFDWLNLIDFNVFFILILMTVVAGFNMISGLLIMLFENISTIGLLKALGMDNRRIAKVFLASSSSVVLKGMLWGNAIAMAFCLLQGKCHLLKLDPANYFISFVPVHLDIWMILLADISAYIMIMLLLLIPSLFITRVDPARTVRMN